MMTAIMIYIIIKEIGRKILKATKSQLEINLKTRTTVYKGGSRV